MKLFFILLFNAITILSFGQREYMVVLAKSSRPIVIVDSFQTTYQSLIVNWDKVKAIKKVTLPSTPCGCASRYVEIVEVADKKTKWSRLNAIYNTFNISRENRSLRVCINNILIPNPDLILADIRDIKRVEVSDHVYSPDLSNPTESNKYLNIVI